MRKDNRLRKNHQFQDIIGARKSEVSKHLVVYQLPNKLGRLRVGISVSKKFANAVGRNRIRRQVRAILDEVNPYNISKDIVLIVRVPFINAAYKDKIASLEKLIQRIK